VSQPLASPPDRAQRDPLEPPQLAHLTTAQLSERLQGWSEPELRAHLVHDPWLLNYVLSVWERDQARAVVTTHPWHQAFVIVEHCNARCRFCAYWLNEESVMEREWFQRLQPVLRFARSLVLTGGEPTLHPELPALLEDLATGTDPRCFRSIITNGLRLPELTEQLLRWNFNVSVSLNAASPELHHQVMHLGRDALPGILDSIRQLKQAGRYVSVSFVVTARSLPEVPAYLALCDQLEVDLAYLRTPNPIEGDARFWSDYGEFAPSQHPDFEALREVALQAIADTRVAIDAYPEQWAVPLPMADQSAARGSELRRAIRRPIQAERGRGQALPGEAASHDVAAMEVADPYARSAPLGCDHVYFSLESLDRARRLEPCCFMTRVPGHEPIGLGASEDFLSLWNAPAMVSLRSRLTQGPLYPMCKVCTYNRLGY
jgi:hypothetical protein